MTAARLPDAARAAGSTRLIQAVGKPVAHERGSFGRVVVDRVLAILPDLSVPSAVGAASRNGCWSASLISGSAPPCITSSGQPMRSRRASKRMRTKLAATASRSALPSIAAACSTKVRNGSSEGAASAPFTQQAAMRGSAAAVDAAHRPPTLLPQMPARPSDGSPTTRSTKQRYAAAISTSTWIRCSSRVSPGPALGQQGGESLAANWRAIGQ